MDAGRAMPVVLGHSVAQPEHPLKLPDRSQWQITSDCYKISARKSQAFSFSFLFFFFLLPTPVFQSNSQVADPKWIGLQCIPDLHQEKGAGTFLKWGETWEESGPKGRRGQDTGHLPRTELNARFIFLLKTHYLSVSGKMFIAIWVVRKA